MYELIPISKVYAILIFVIILARHFSRSFEFREIFKCKCSSSNCDHYVNEELLLNVESLMDGYLGEWKSEFFVKLLIARLFAFSKKILAYKKADLRKPSFFVLSACSFLCFCIDLTQNCRWAGLRNLLAKSSRETFPVIFLSMKTIRK